MKIIMENNVGHKIICKQGFSWTTLFFGCFVPLLRGDLKWAFIMFILAFLTCGISWFIVPFTYNKSYINDLQTKGYKII